MIQDWLQQRNTEFLRRWNIARNFELGTVHSVDGHCQPCWIAFIQSGSITKSDRIFPKFSPLLIQPTIIHDTFEVPHVGIGHQLSICSGYSRSLVLLKATTFGAKGVLALMPKSDISFPMSMIHSHPGPVGWHRSEVSHVTLGHLQQFRQSDRWT